MRSLSILIFIISTTANAESTWRHPTNTESDFYRDSMQCNNYAIQAEQQAMERDIQSGTLYGNAFANPYADPDVRNAYKSQQIQQAVLAGQLMRRLTSKDQYSNCMKSLGYIN